MTDTLPVPELEATNCPLCDSDQHDQVLEAPDNLCDIPGTWSVSSCRQCGHRFMNPRPTAATLHLCYPEHYGPHQAPPVPAANEASDTAPAAAAPRPWYLKVLPLGRIPGLKSLYHWLLEDQSQPLPHFPSRTDREAAPQALELGCSTGQYLSRLSAAGWAVEGVEPSETASEKARQAGYQVSTGTLDTIPLQDAAYESASAWMVIEHVPDPRHTLGQLQQSLKPGGQLLISIPNAGCWEPHLFGDAWYVWELPRHLHHFTPATIRRLLQDCGFVDVQVMHQKNILNIIGSLGVALRRRSLTHRLGERLLRYPDSPRLWVQLALSPLAHLLSFLRQGGRLTVSARRPMEAAGSPESTSTQGPHA